MKSTLRAIQARASVHGPTCLALLAPWSSKGQRWDGVVTVCYTFCCNAATCSRRRTIGSSVGYVLLLPHDDHLDGRAHKTHRSVCPLYCPRLFLRTSCPLGSEPVRLACTQRGTRRGLVLVCSGRRCILPHCTIRSPASPAHGGTVVSRKPAYRHLGVRRPS
jgi:hypothetical protein